MRELETHSIISLEEYLFSIKKMTKENRSEGHIAKILREIDLIDSMTPDSLPLYINYEWSAEESRRRYVDKLENAYELEGLIEKIKNNKNDDFEITF